MKCPQCENVLVTLEFDRIEIDYCPGCRGIWLDSGELGLLLERDEERNILFNAPGSVRCKERKRKCPICSGGMKKVLVCGSDVLLDECAGHGLWFDNGELKKILGAGCADSREEDRLGSLVALLDEIFVPGGEERT
jgi:Zn-finger nucleic acid-binding protein